MKKWIIGLVLLMCCSCVLPTQAANWQFIDEDLQGGKWYIDNSSVVKEYGRAKAWITWIDEDGYRFVELIEVTKDRTMTMLEYTVYDSSMEVVDSYVFGAWERKTMSIVPNTAMEGIYNMIW